MTKSLSKIWDSINNISSITYGEMLNLIDEIFAEYYCDFEKTKNQIYEKVLSRVEKNDTCYAFTSYILYSKAKKLMGNTADTHPKAKEYFGLLQESYQVSLTMMSQQLKRKLFKYPFNVHDIQRELSKIESDDELSFLNAVLDDINNIAKETDEFKSDIVEIRKMCFDFFESQSSKKADKFITGRQKSLVMYYLLKAAGDQGVNRKGITLINRFISGLETDIVYKNVYEYKSTANLLMITQDSKNDYKNIIKLFQKAGYDSIAALAREDAP